MSTDTIEQAENGSAPQAEAELTRHDLFKYAEHVHVGEGAEECEHATDGKCENDEHFHAWCRLPNPFQVRDISEKAKAARARKTRMLKDPESDAYVVLEAELDPLKDESAREVLVDEIVERDFVEDYDAAVKNVLDLDDPDYVPKDESDEIPKLYANIDQDSEEYQRQRELPEDRRDEDWPELEKTVAAYSQAVNSELEKIRKPKIERLMARDMSELVDIVRNERISAQSTEAYLHTFNTWQWFVCTFKPREKGTPNERVFKDFTQFKYETPSEVVGALQVCFAGLESRLAGDRAKNS
jgi:hypothetical protein